MNLQTIDEYNRERIYNSGESFGNPFYPQEVTTMLEFHDIVIRTSISGLVRRFDIFSEEAEYLYDSAQKFDVVTRGDEKIEGEKLFEYLYVLSRISAIAKGEVH